MIIIENLNDVKKNYKNIPKEVISEINTILDLSKCVEQNIIVIYINKKTDFKKVKEFYVDINKCAPIYVDTIINSEQNFYNVLYEGRVKKAIIIISPKNLAIKSICEYNKNLIRRYQKY